MDALPPAVHLLGLSEAPAWGEGRGGGRWVGGGERVVSLQIQHTGGGGEEEVEVELGRGVGGWLGDGGRVGSVEGRTLTGLYREEEGKGCAVKWDGGGGGGGKVGMVVRPGLFCTVEVRLVKAGEEEVSSVVRRGKGKGR